MLTDKILYEAINSWPKLAEQFSTKGKAALFYLRLFKYITH